MKQKKRFVFDIGARVAQWVWVRAQLCKLQKRCTRFTAASDKVYQLLAQDRWFFPGTPASSTTKTGRHDIAEILLKLVLNTKIQIQIQYNRFRFPQEYPGWVHTHLNENNFFFIILDDGIFWSRLTPFISDIVWTLVAIFFSEQNSNRSYFL